MLLAEARDTLGASNYSKILINVLDVNDNAPLFGQTHYDALLQADGQFESPLVVQAHDLDEPNSANSQLAYEIIAGNQNEQFAIDSLSGLVYLTGRQPTLQTAPQPSSTRVSIPSILSEPIVPHSQNEHNRRQLDSAGKILPLGGGSREIEETTQRQPLRLNWPPRSAASMAAEQRDKPKEPSSAERAGRISAPMLDLNDQMPALGLLLGLEAEPSRQLDGSLVAATTERAPEAAPSSRSKVLQPPPPPPLESAAAQAPAHFEPLSLPPVTTLVVRAHDFGIPIRSATCKVNIYNQALQSRSLSVILNGTVEQLSERREAIERSLGALTGSRAHLDSLEALSDSSSLTVARVRLVVPTGHHQLVDLTDLSALMQALDYKLPQSASDQQQQQQQQQRHATTGPTYIVPIHSIPLSSSNLSAAATGLPIGQPGLYTDTQINSFALESSALEKRLLIYIIIVGICILALLVIWMIYSCCHEDRVK